MRAKVYLVGERLVGSRKYKENRSQVFFVWRIGLLHPAKSQNHRIFKDATILYNMSFPHENIILTE